MKFIDKTGMIFGKLTVLGKAQTPPKAKGSYWECRCECGKELIVSGANLKPHSTCGCGRITDMVGFKSGRLTVIARAGKYEYSPLWECLCECGNKQIVSANSLRRRMTRSCGCLHLEIMKEFRLPDGEAAFNQYFKGVISRSKIANLEMTLTSDEVKSIIFDDCFYCGKAPNQTTRTKSGDIIIRNGLDRIDNRKGYTKDNVVPCCKRCNIAKNDLTQKEFLDLILAIYQNLKLGENNGTANIIP